MWPVLFRIPNPLGEPFPIRMFGLLVIIGFLCGTWLVGRRLKRFGVMSSAETFDFCFYLLAVGILGSRLMFVLQNFDQFRGRFFDVFKIWEGGLVWYGGFALAALFAFWWTWKRKLPVLHITDACALGLALALAIGRWGCFCAGDDYGLRCLAMDGSPIETMDGSQAMVPWFAVQFPAFDPSDWRTAYCEAPVDFRAPYWVHPVQIYMSLANFFVLGALWLVARRQQILGVLTASYLITYPIARFVVEFWRGDVDRGVDLLWGMSFSQMFGIPILLVGVWMLRLVRRHGARVDEPLTNRSPLLDSMP